MINNAAFFWGYIPWLRSNNSTMKKILKWLSNTCLKYNCWGYAKEGSKYCSGCVEDDKNK